MSTLDGKPSRFGGNATVAPGEYQFQPLPELLECVEVQTAGTSSKKLSFSRILARRIGIVPALVLKYLAYKVYYRKNERENKIWYYAPYREIASHYRFIGESTVYRAIKYLESESLIEIGNHNKRKADRTAWFTVTMENRDLCERDLIYFLPDDASLVGYKAAIVYGHAKRALEDQHAVLRDGWLRIWPSDYAELQPLSKQEIRSALRTLVRLGFLEKKSDGVSNCHYRLGDKSPVCGVYGFEALPITFEARIPSF